MMEMRIHFLTKLLTAEKPFKMSIQLFYSTKFIYIYIIYRYTKNNLLYILYYDFE